MLQFLLMAPSCGVLCVIIISCMRILTIGLPHLCHLGDSYQSVRWWLVLQG
jgi:hypothetical protein